MRLPENALCDTADPAQIAALLPNLPREIEKATVEAVLQMRLPQ